MKENVARDLIALSAIAFNQGDYTAAGKLFSQAMSCADSGEFLDSLLENNNSLPILAESLISSSESDDIGSISDAIGKAIKSDVKSTSTIDRKASLRSDEEVIDDFKFQPFESDSSVKSILGFKLKK